MNGATLAIIGAASLLIGSVDASERVKYAPGYDISSGDYGGGMLIGFDPSSRVISGYFRSFAANKQFSCIFFMKGKLADHHSEIETYFPEMTDDAIKGVLIRESRDRFQVRLPREHGGCWNVQHFADKEQPAEFTLKAFHPWLSIAVVKRDRVYLFDSPTSAVHRNAYVVKGDGVGVRGIKPGWLQIDFIGNTKPISGWIRKTDVFPTTQ